jgi:hypothetical protein
MKGCRSPVVPCSGFAPLRLRRQPSTPTIPVPGTSSPGSRDLRLRHAHLRPRRIHSARPGQSEQVAKQVASAQSLSGGCLRQPPLTVRPRSESSARRARVPRSGPYNLTWPERARCEAGRERSNSSVRQSARQPRLEETVGLDLNDEKPSNRSLTCRALGVVSSGRSTRLRNLGGLAMAFETTKRVSGVRCPVSGVRCPVSGVRCPVSGVRCRVFWQPV